MCMQLSRHSAPTFLSAFVAIKTHNYPADRRAGPCNLALWMIKSFFPIGPMLYLGRFPGRGCFPYAGPKIACGGFKKPVEASFPLEGPSTLEIRSILARTAPILAIMFWKCLAAAALLAQDAAAQNVNVGKLLRFACTQLVIERIDPIVQPETIPSSHTHQVVGGNSFNVTVAFSPSPLLTRSL